MEDPFDDHCHCHLHNIHRRAGCACLECALERELPHYKTKLWHQVNIGNKGKEKILLTINALIRVLQIFIKIRNVEVRWDLQVMHKTLVLPFGKYY
jgi:hypothetical protein